VRRIYWINPLDERISFPPVERALLEPDGLLAAGGDLSVERLELAYRSGIFPWYEPGQPILWWSPDPRAVLFPRRLRLGRSLRKALRNRPWQVSFDHAFADVVAACAEPRAGASGTWITSEMLEDYTALHRQGLAHSVEIRRDGHLVGGLYGVAIGRVFFGESMFSRVPDASKVALAHLARHLDAWDYALIDCQLPNPHLLGLGAELMPRDEFVERVSRHASQSPSAHPWSVDPTLEVDTWRPEADS
jgi:leucyl/phenylalanyl-tRNA--protein transferase